MTLTVHDPFVLPKVDGKYQWSHGRQSRWNVPYPMLNSTLWDTPYKEIDTIFDWVIDSRNGEFRDLTVMSATAEKAEAVAVGAALDLIRQGGSVVNDTRALRCMSAFDVQEAFRDKSDEVIGYPVLMVLEVPTPSNKWLFDAFVWASQKRRRVRGATIFWTRAAVYAELTDAEMELLRGAHVDLDAA